MDNKIEVRNINNNRKIYENNSREMNNNSREMVAHLIRNSRRN